jgi:hypothetical protein
MDAKPWYLSKTILVNILMGIALIVAQFSPSAAEFIRTYFAEAGTAWALVNIVLRLLTKKEVG